MFNDLMENIEWFFNLHDKNKDGYLTKDEVLTLSESLLVSANTLAIMQVLTSSPSSSSDSRSAMHTSELSAGSCPMRLSTVMLFFHGQMLRTMMASHGHLKLSQISPT